MKQFFFDIFGKKKFKFSVFMFFESISVIFNLNYLKSQIIDFAIFYRNY